MGRDPDLPCLAGGGLSFFCRPEQIRTEFIESLVLSFEALRMVKSAKTVLCVIRQHFLVLIFINDRQPYAFGRKSERVVRYEWSESLWSGSCRTPNSR